MGTSGCGSEQAADPSYLLVELVPAEDATTNPRSVRVQIANATSTLTTLCVNIDGPPGEPAASFVLRRDAGKPATERISIEVSAFEALSGQETVQVGKEFGCPQMLPPSMGMQGLAVDFCETEARRLTFHVGSTCSCAMDETCGAGITTAGKPCGPGVCCKNEVSSACALEAAK